MRRIDSMLVLILLLFPVVNVDASVHSTSTDEMFPQWRHGRQVVGH